MENIIDFENSDNLKIAKKTKEKKIWYKKLPKSRGRNFSDDLWSLLVKMRDGNKCVICGSETMASSHHLISRRVFKYRFSTINGTTVCPKCHKFSLVCSYHTAPWETELWLSKNRPEQYAVWIKNRSAVSEDDEKFVIDYDEIYYGLEQQHKEMTGIYFRIERIPSYICFKNYDIITSMLSEKIKLQEICERICVPIKVLKEFITKNKLNTQV